MKSLSVIILSVFFFVMHSFAQEDTTQFIFDHEDEDKEEVSKSRFRENLFFGGGFGFQIGTITSIELLPEVSYRFHPKFYIGIGGHFSYLKNFSYDYQAAVYGGKAFARFYVYNNLFLQGEFELLNVKEFDFDSLLRYTGRRIFVSGVLGGIGYRQKLGERSAVLFTLMYNFAITRQTPYLNPVFRVSLEF